MYFIRQLHIHLMMMTVLFFYFPIIAYSAAAQMCDQSANNCQNLAGQWCYVTGGGTTSCSDMCGSGAYTSSCQPNSSAWEWDGNKFCQNVGFCYANDVICECKCKGNCSGNTLSCTDLCSTNGGLTCSGT